MYRSLESSSAEAVSGLQAQLTSVESGYSVQVKALSEEIEMERCKALNRAAHAVVERDSVCASEEASMLHAYEEEIAGLKVELGAVKASLVLIEQSKDRCEAEAMDAQVKARAMQEEVKEWEAICQEMQDKVLDMRTVSEHNRELEARLLRQTVVHEEESSKLRGELDELVNRFQDLQERARVELESEARARADEVEKGEARCQALQREMAVLEGELSSHKRLLEEERGTREGMKNLKETLEKRMFDMKETFGNFEKQSIASKQQIQRLETENRQCQVIIQQLRQVRKVSKEDVDSIMMERDQLASRLEQQTLELGRMTSCSQAMKLENDALKGSDKDLQELKANYSNLEAILKQERSTLLEVEKLNFEKEYRYQNMKSDNQLLKEDLTQRNLELSNLLQSISQFQHDRELEITRLHNEYKVKFSIHERKCKEEMNIEIAKAGDVIRLLEKTIQQQRQTLEDDALMRRRTEMEIASERKKMQATFNDTIARLKNSQEDVVDRTLVSNLLVSYFQRKRSLDVLELIARILVFSEEQKAAVGLKPSAVSFVSFFQSIVGAPQKPVENLEGYNLAEMWVNFLLVETESESRDKSKSPPLGSAGQTPMSPPPSPVASSSSASSSPSNAQAHAHAHVNRSFFVADPNTSSSQSQQYSPDNVEASSRSIHKDT